MEYVSSGFSLGENQENVCNNYQISLQSETGLSVNVHLPAAHSCLVQEVWNLRRAGPNSKDGGLKAP